MAAYPILPTASGSDPKPLKSIDIDRAEDGTARGRSLSADKVKVSIKHNLLTLAQKATLDAFYTANRLIAFDYTSPADNALRSCLFAAPIAWEREPGDYYNARVEVEQV